jgi:hypothetical protein
VGWRGQDARDADARRRPPMPPDIARRQRRKFVIWRSPWRSWPGAGSASPS